MRIFTLWLIIREYIICIYYLFVYFTGPHSAEFVFHCKLFDFDLCKSVGTGRPRRLLKLHQKHCCIGDSRRGLWRPPAVNCPHRHRYLTACSPAVDAVCRCLGMLKRWGCGWNKSLEVSSCIRTCPCLNLHTIAPWTMETNEIVPQSPASIFKAQATIPSTLRNYELK